MLNRLERIFGRFAIPNLALYIVIGQVGILLARMMHAIDGTLLLYAPIAIVIGQWWRLITFVFYIEPGAFFGSTIAGYAMLVFGWQLFYLMGGALEHQWGAFRFNAYLFTGWLLAVVFAFGSPREVVDNIYLLSSVFLAFAYLNPDFEILFMFILPLKVKWLAVVTWVFYAYQLVRGSMGDRLQIIAVIVTFALFFAGDLVRRGKQQQRVSARRAERVREEAQPRHVCHVCGKTDLTNPEMDFRYCSKCAGDQCYCPDHIHNHAHVVAPESQG